MLHELLYAPSQQLNNSTTQTVSHQSHNFMYDINKIFSHQKHVSQPTCHKNTTIKQLAIILAIYHINPSTTKTQPFSKRFITSSWKPQQQYTHRPGIIIPTLTTTVYFSVLAFWCFKQHLDQTYKKKVMIKIAWICQLIQ